MLFRLLRVQLRPYGKEITLVVLFQFVQTLATLYLPTLNADIIDDGVVKGDTGTILRVGLVMLGVTLIQITCSIVAVYYGAYTSMALGRDLRAAVFHRVQDFSVQEVNKFGPPSLITRSTNDVQQIQLLVMMTLIMMVAAPIMCVGGIVLAVRQDTALSSLLLVVLPVMVVAVGLIVVRMRPLFRLMQERIDRINQVLREQITGIRVIRAFVRDQHERERFAVANDRLTDVSLKAGRLMALMFPSVMLIVNLSSIAVVWFGGHRIAGGDMQVGALTAVISYLMQILMSVMMATFMFMMIPRAEVCAERIKEVLDTEPTVHPPAKPVTPERRIGELELRSVGFRYPGAEEPVLSDITFTARPGRTTAIIGGTGSGKTTLLNLIPRLFDATDGEVLVDGVNVRDLDPAVLSRIVGLVPQAPYLFSGTVASNLRYGRPDATDEELWHALEIAQAREFVEAMPNKLEEPIAQGGTNVSGGQRQRLALARAVVRRPRLLILDDATSSVDPQVEAKILHGLRDAAEASTVVVVAYRMATISLADEVVYLDHGRVVDRGTHEELIGRCEGYRNLVTAYEREEAERAAIELSDIDIEEEGVSA